MSNYDTFLLCSVILGIGMFFTRIWEQLYTTLRGLDALEDGGPLWKTALLGAGLGAISALINEHVQTPLQFAACVAASSAFTVHGRTFFLAAQAMLRDKDSWAIQRHLAAFTAALVDKQFHTLYDSPENLQAYLDRTYGAGVVDVKTVYRTLGKPKTSAPAIQ